ncbi:major facilitator superfamily protein [Striga asiatica]|uniref:Major facilitator superfamily protein n=1 Tax=Striga asiatica TaxID=4170 RepID=A0A5A7QV29_STRAF|nr:major facilitator superfamily protein [Striga asiatica]
MKVVIGRLQVVFSRAMLFTLGLVFAHSLVDAVVLSILITHLTAEWKEYSLWKAAIVVNVQEGTLAVAHIVFILLSDAWTGPYKMLLCSTAISALGLSLFQVENVVSFYGPLVLVTLSQAGIVVTLRPFFDDQVMSAAGQSTVETQHWTSIVWWKCITLLAAASAAFGLSRINPFGTLSWVSAIIMGSALFWFLLGTKFYSFTEPTGSPVRDAAHVMYTAAVTKRNAEYPKTPNQLYQNSSGHMKIPPHVSWLRCLDKAAVVMPQDQEKPGDICTVEQVMVAKSLLKMLPIWMTFLTFSTVSATGSTFFLEEAASIDQDFNFLTFIFWQRTASFVVTFTCCWALDELGRKMKVEQRMILVRMGMGMVCCMACCVAAWINARHWRLVDSMSVSRLVPQYVLLGVMEGLSIEGLDNFFTTQVAELTARYGPAFVEFVLGIGKFLNALCIYVLTLLLGWFGEDVYSSRLDKYYLMLAILSSLNVIIYCLVACWYGDWRFPIPAEDDDIETANDNPVEEAVQEMILQREKDSLPLLEQKAGRDTQTLRSRSFTRPSFPMGAHKCFYSMRS